MSQIAIVQAFTGIHDTRRTAGQRPRLLTTVEATFQPQETSLWL